MNNLKTGKKYGNRRWNQTNRHKDHSTDLFNPDSKFIACAILNYFEAGGKITKVVVDPKDFEEFFEKNSAP